MIGAKLQPVDDARGGVPAFKIDELVRELAGRVIVGNGLWRDFYLKNPGECDRWLKANAVFGSILAIAMLAMAVVGHYSAGPDGATEISAVKRSSK
jgi:hypothetical protein